jgi:hypothetical protein
VFLAEKWEKGVLGSTAGWEEGCLCISTPGRHPWWDDSCTGTDAVDKKWMQQQALGQLSSLSNRSNSSLCVATLCVRLTCKSGIVIGQGSNAGQVAVAHWHTQQQRQQQRQQQHKQRAHK